ncbi:site-specific integrase [Streptomyces sp. NPDC049881]|uniref:tyrosine-type recombinase/integrase n=1 Tax=Streptomyces sp. NPDC049881 TaxID=3155778 RepID=UPI0034306FDC
MPASRSGGAVVRRCYCRDATGRSLGAACPELAKRSHGVSAIRQELPPTAEGARRTFRRTGYATVTEARADLDKVRDVLDVADADDEDAQRRVGDLLAAVQAEGRPIPDAAEVKKRLHGGVALDGSVTVGDWLDQWAGGRKGAKKKTVTGYLSHIRLHLRPALGHIRLDRLNVGQAQAMFRAIDARNEVIAEQNQQRREQEARCRWGHPGKPPPEVSARLAVERERLAAMPPYRRPTGPATQQRIRATLRAALNAAIAQQLITFNPAEHVELASGRRPKPQLWTAARVARWRETGEIPGPVMVWTVEQVGAFLDAAERQFPRLYPLYHLIAFRGLRRGEAIGLDWSGVDLDGQQITIGREIIVHEREVIEDTPKTDGSAATIGLDSVNVQLLREHQARRQAERAEWNAHAAAERAKKKTVADWVDTGKVFTRLDGGWLHPEEDVSDAFRAIVRAAGLPPISLRDLRHCAATLIHAGGGDLHVIKEVLRHSTIQLASDTYTSLLREVDLDVAERAVALVPRGARSAPAAAGVSDALLLAQLTKWAADPAALPPGVRAALVADASELLATSPALSAARAGQQDTEVPESPAEA